MMHGLTGLWQVSGRSDITDFEEVVQLDNEYMHSSAPWEMTTGISNEWVFRGDEGDSYILALRDTALSCGMTPVFFTCTVSVFPSSSTRAINRFGLSRNTARRMFSYFMFCSCLLFRAGAAVIPSRSSLTAPPAAWIPTCRQTAASPRFPRWKPIF